jgi:pSer/pThr/pTyr-binding forkhead associated (FHA) protein
MSAPIPCPCCGSDIGPGHEACSTCGYALSPLRESNAGGSKCARCGAMMPLGFDFCPVCGQDQRVRLRRPPTQEIRIGMASSAARPAGSMGAPVVPHHLPPPPPMGAPMSHDAAVAAGRTVVPPSPPASAFAPPQPPGYAPPAPYSAPIDRTVPAPSSPLMPGGQYPHIPLPQAPGRVIPPPPPSRATGRSQPSQGQGSLIAAVADADTMQPPAGMPAVMADERDDDRTVPEPHHMASRPSMPSAGGDDDRTVPHARMHPVAIAPVRANVSPATQPDRPGGFSGGPGHGPLPTVNRAKSSTLAPIQPTSTSRAVVGAGTRGMPRLVLVARDGSEGESFPMLEEQMTIGRTHGDLLFPEDPFLSPMHVRVQRTPKGFALFDAGSTNGVYLRIRGSAPVYPGDQFMIGHQLLRLENIDTQVQERPPAIDGTRVFGTPLQPAWGCVRQIGRGGIVGDKYYLRGSQVVFGREGGDLLFPNDPFVSREHARLRLELRGQTMAVFLEDLESANGSYIRIRGSAEMSGMDTFRIGDQILRLRLD